MPYVERRQQIIIGKEMVPIQTGRLLQIMEARSAHVVSRRRFDSPLPTDIPSAFAALLCGYSMTLQM